MQACTHALLERAVKENAFFSVKLWAYLKRFWNPALCIHVYVCVFLRTSSFIYLNFLFIFIGI